MTLGSSPPSACICGHRFHTQQCDGTTPEGTGLAVYPVACDCPFGELDADR